MFFSKSKSLARLVGNLFRRHRQHLPVGFMISGRFEIAGEGIEQNMGSAQGFERLKIPTDLIEAPFARHSVGLGEGIRCQRELDTSSDVLLGRNSFRSSSILLIVKTSILTPRHLLAVANRTANESFIAACSVKK